MKNQTKKISIYDRQIPNKKGADVSLSSFSFLFSEMIAYSHENVTGIQELETKLSDFGYKVGFRVLELHVLRDKNFKRESTILGALSFVHSVIWKQLFGKVCDALEKSTENADECIFINFRYGIIKIISINIKITDNNPIVSKFISVPRELGLLNCAAFMAGYYYNDILLLTKDC